MKAIFAPLTAALVLVTILGMAYHQECRTTAALMLRGAALHALARQWGKLSSLPVKVTVDVTHDLLRHLVDGVALLVQATDGDPHVTDKWPCP